MDTETSPKPEVAPVPIWRCRNNECKAWMRKEMSDDDSPGCPLCGGPMLRGIRHLPKLDKKPIRKKKSEQPAWTS
ncbi:cold-inducible protein YdjO-related protein [Marinicrinis lubricantis]|uniref:Cold-inducible protein YdjO-related protein n=1 Tax=Marinicrinis lubricantis TaxID=2086470 RepID=A0ABW1IR37_9BACL